MTRYLPAKLVAFLMSLYVFFAGIPYGDEPVTVDFTATTNQYEYEAGDDFFVQVEWENIGRPFIGLDNDTANVSFYKEEDGMKKYITIIGNTHCHTMDPRQVLIKHGYKDTVFTGGAFDEETEPGVYNMVVKLYGTSKIYPNAIVVK